MPDEAVHPGATVLIVALEVVAVKQGHRLAVRVAYFKNADVGLVDGNVRSFFKRDAVELGGGVKHAILKDVVQLEIGLNLRLFQVVLSLAHLVAVEIPIPGLQLEAALLSLDERLNLACLFASLPGGAGHERVHELDGCLGRLRHLVLEFPGGVVGKTKQLGFFGA